MKYLLAALLAGTLAGCALNAPIKKEEPEPIPEPPKQEVKQEEPKPQPKPLALEAAYFEYNQSSLSADAKAALKRDVEQLLAHPEAKVSVDGHCDERGTEQYNVDLGWKRAYTVRDYLKRQGIDKSRLYPASFGRSRPAVVGTDESAWSKNRRVELSEKK